jgi:hypothetical protein
MEAIITILSSWFLFDLWFFSQWWAYVFILPILFYIPFFFLKWIVITAPLWIPFRFMFSGIINITKNINKSVPSSKENTNDGYKI